MSPVLHLGVETAPARRRNERGQALIEFALGSMVFFLTVFATFELGRAIWNYNMVSNLAQEGARWATVRGGASSSPASSGDVQTFVQSRSSIPVTVTTTSSSGASGACTTTAVNPSSLSAGSGVCVTVQTTFQPVTMFVPSLNLQGTAKMVMAR